MLLRITCARPTQWAALVLCVLCVNLLMSAAHALDGDKFVTQYMHTSWRIQDGSLPSGMFSITQTSDGFLWFLSLPGDIYRFDGVRFVPWRLPGDFGSGPAGKLLADRNGGLWIAANELLHVKGDAVLSHFKLRGLHVFQSIIQDPEGALWVGLRDSEVPLCRVTDTAVKCYGKDDGVSMRSINTLLADGKGGLWIGGEKAIEHWHQGGHTEKYQLPKGTVSALARSSDGTVWIGIEEGDPDKGLLRLKGDKLEPFAAPGFDPSGVSVTSLLVDHDDNLWVTTDSKGLLRIRDNRAESYRQINGLSGDSAWELFEDREGIVWAGTTSGIDGFRDPAVTTFSAVQGLGKDLAAGIAASKDGTIWVANSGSLDRIQAGKVTSIRKNDGLPGDQVAAIMEDHAGNMWVGVDDGLYLFKNGHFRQLTGPDHQPLGMVMAMVEDVDGNLWAECRGDPSKLVRIRDLQVREVFPKSQVPLGSRLASDPHGGIWIVGSKDLALFRNGKVETKVSLGATGSPLHRHIVVQADGSVLLGTENGLVGWRNGKLQRMTTRNGLPCDFIIAFAQDKAQNWWLYTRCGVVQLSDKDLQRWWTNPETAVQSSLYDAFDGAQPNIGSFNAAATTPDGKVWFSSGVVVQMVDPFKQSPNAILAQTYIQSVVVDRKELVASNNLRLAPNPREVQIDYTSPTFLIPQQVRFRYRLDGFDHEWHEAGTRRQAFYTDLHPGNYTFRVMASNSDDVWNENAASLSFSVNPAFYQTSWFRLLCVALLLVSLWAAHQLRVRRMQQQFEMTLDARVNERTRIAREVHDTLLQGAHGVLLRFETAAQLLPDRANEAKQMLNSAIKQTADFITDARDEVQGLRESTLQGNDLAIAVSTLGEDLANRLQSERPILRVAVEGESRNFHPIARDEIYKIAAEALRNIFKHAHARRVEVELRYDDKQFRLRVRDDGIGVSSEILTRTQTDGHYGIHGMQERAKLIEGKLTIWSEVNAGTEVELSVPADRAYEKEQKGSWLRRKSAAKV